MDSGRRERMRARHFRARMSYTNIDRLHFRVHKQVCETELHRLYEHIPSFRAM